MINQLNSRKTALILLITFVSAVFIQSSEYNTNKKSDILIEIDVTKIQDGKIKDLINKVSFVNLETSNSCLIGTINKILFKNNSIFITDRSKTVLYIFNINGKFQRIISNTGNGPGEFLSIDDFDISPKDSQIIILDNLQQKLLKYSFQGIFKEEFKFSGEYFPRSLALVEDKIVFELGPVTKNDSFYRAMITDESLKVTSHIIKEKLRESITIGNNCHFQDYGRDVNYIPPMQNSMFRINSNEVLFKQTFDFGKYNMNIDALAPKLTSSRENTINAIELGNFVYFLNAFENDSMIFFYFCINKIMYRGLYSKNSKRYFLYKGEEESHRELELLPLTTYNNQFISYIESPAKMGNSDASSLKHSLDSSSEIQGKRNPILVFTQYKTF